MNGQIEIFADGACLGNPGKGGYGVILRYKNYEKRLSGGFFLTTNNRMELMAAIVALSTLKRPCQIKFVSDSKYLKQGITTWIYRWKRNNWKTTGNKQVKNMDLWQLLDKSSASHQIQWIWVKGHSGHHENEICDKLAREAAKQPQSEDSGYLLKDV